MASVYVLLDGLNREQVAEVLSTVERYEKKNIDKIEREIKRKNRIGTYQEEAANER